VGAQPQGEVALGEGAVIAQVAFDDPAGTVVFGWAEEADAGEGAPGRPLAVVAVAVGAVALALLPAAVGISILLGTLPPALGAGVVLTLLTFIKVGAAAGGIAAALGAPRTPVPEASPD
jgi:hypothetical protein